jgi:undecaprenyl-phosphate galactose phosphotransferase
MRHVKLVFDLVVAALLLVVLLLPCLLVALIIRHDGGTTFFAHKRIGKSGRSFYCLKFRTMVVDADRKLHEMLISNPAKAIEWAATYKLIDDPRVTPIGRFLRRTSLDELPQLINILRLEMSLVGPRPIVASEVPLYGDRFADYCAVRPGITGVWQTQGRSHTAYETRVQLDQWYVRNWTFWLDIRLLLKTIPVVFGGEGAH